MTTFRVRSRPAAIGRPLPRLLLCLWFVAASAFALDPAAIRQQLEQLREASQAPGVSAAVMVGGELVYSGGVGLADVENAVPMDGGTVHNIGSVSKVLGAIAMMQLVEQGKIDLDAEIQAYAPWFPRKQAPITLRQIMTHTSGIRHYREGEFGEGDVLQFRHYDDIETASRRWQDDPLLFAPGQYWNYSSYATNLLQAAIERASGQGLEDYLRAHIWEPAGMAATSLDVPMRIAPRRARGYLRDPASGELFNAVQEDVSYKYVGGGILASDEDLVRMGHALNAGGLLGEAAITEMYRPQLDASIVQMPSPDGTPAAGERPAQGLIWRIQQDAAGRRYFAHGGSVKGTLSYLVNYPEQDVVVAVHANAWGGKADLRVAAEAIAAQVLGQ